MTSNARSLSEAPSSKMILEMLKSPSIGAEFDSIVKEVLYDELNDVITDICNQFLPNRVRELREMKSKKDLVDYSDLFAAVRERFPGCEITKWNYKDETGSVYGFPENISADVVYAGDEVYFCDIDHEIGIMNLILLIRTANQFAILNGKSPGCIIFTRKACDRAILVADRLNIKMVFI